MRGCISARTPDACAEVRPQHDRMNNRAPTRRTGTGRTGVAQHTSITSQAPCRSAPWPRLANTAVLHPGSMHSARRRPPTPRHCYPFAPALYAYCTHTACHLHTHPPLVAHVSAGMKTYLNVTFSPASAMAASSPPMLGRAAADGPLLGVPLPQVNGDTTGTSDEGGGHAGVVPAAERSGNRASAPAHRRLRDVTAAAFSVMRVTVGEHLVGASFYATPTVESSRVISSVIGVRRLRTECSVSGSFTSPLLNGCDMHACRSTQSTSRLRIAADRPRAAAVARAG